MSAMKPNRDEVHALWLHRHMLRLNVRDLEREVERLRTRTELQTVTRRLLYTALWTIPLFYLAVRVRLYFGGWIFL